MFAMLRTVLMAAFASSLFSTGLWAQRPDTQELIREMEIARTITAEHRGLQKLVGTWDVTTNMVMAGFKSTVPPSHSIGRATSILGGRFVEMQRTGGMMMGVAIESRITMGYDTTRKMFSSVSLSTLSTGMIVSHGKKEADGSIAYEGKIYEFPTKDGRPIKHTTTWVNNDHFRVDVYNWVGGKWSKVVVEEYVRTNDAFLTGLRAFEVPVGEKKTWDFKDGILTTTGAPAGYLRTKAYNANYELTFEWRFTGKPGNGGCLIHSSAEGALGIWPQSLEVQLQSGSAGDFWMIGEKITVPNQSTRQRGKRRIPRLASAGQVENAVGEWNAMKIRADGRSVRVWINGTLVNEGTQCSAKGGQICIQSEGAAMAFRNMDLVQIPKKK